MFPQPIQLGEACTRWRLSDVEEWEEQKTGIRRLTAAPQETEGLRECEEVVQ